MKKEGIDKGIEKIRRPKHGDRWRKKDKEGRIKE